jgi:hypothetical protein
MAMSQESWDAIIKVLLLKMHEQGQKLDLANPYSILDVMRDNWDLVCSHSACCKYLAEKELEYKKAEREAELARLAKLDAEIKALEG